MTRIADLTGSRLALLSRKHSENMWLLTRDGLNFRLG